MEQSLQPSRKLELWLDCRNGNADCPVPLACDRRLVVSSGAFRKRDLVCDALSGQAIDDTGKCVAMLLTCTAMEVQCRALEMVGLAEWLVLEAERLVPNEALLTASSRQGTRIAVVVCSEQHLKDLESILERIDALAVSMELWDNAVQARSALASKANAPMLDTVRGGLLLPATEELKAAEVESVRLIEGGGDRVYLDFIQMLTEGEGCLVGSTAQALCFVHAQTAPTGNQPARPFRINAGLVHACVALPDGRTKYLSDVVAGDQVLVMDVASLTTRGVTIGRCHVERCPVMCIDLRCQGNSFNIFAEHSDVVRLHVRRATHGEEDATLSPLPVTKVYKGDHVFVHWISSANDGDS